MQSLKVRHIIALFIILNSCEYENAEINLYKESVYHGEIVPILNRSCAITGCHVQGSAVGNFNEYADLKTRIDNGKFKLLVFDLKIMPPLTYPPLSNDELIRLKSWINQGAPEN